MQKRPGIVSYHYRRVHCEKSLTVLMSIARCLSEIHAHRACQGESDPSSRLSQYTVRGDIRSKLLLSPNEQQGACHSQHGTNISGLATFNIQHDRLLEEQFLCWTCARGSARPKLNAFLASTRPAKIPRATATIISALLEKIPLLDMRSRSSALS